MKPMYEILEGLQNIEEIVSPDAFDDEFNPLDEEETEKIYNEISKMQDIVRRVIYDTCSD